MGSPECRHGKLHKMGLQRKCRASVATRKQILIALLHLGVANLMSGLQTCSARETNLTLVGKEPSVLGVWNGSLHPATQFRSNSIRRYFDIWPEDISISGRTFKYFCEDPAQGNLSLSNFTYSLSEGRLDPRPYFDLGIVDSFQPYWLYGDFWSVDMKKLSYPINCEYHDLQHLYIHRCKMTMKVACAATIVMQCMIQFVVASAMSLRWGYVFWKDHTSHYGVGYRLKLLRGWFWNLQWGGFFSDSIHMGFLSAVGYCMMEAVGHSDLRNWRTTIMYNMGVVYSVLTILAMMSSTLRQIAYGCTEPDDQRNLQSKEPEERNIRQEIWCALHSVSDDWRWQRVFLQLGVLVLTGTYLSFVQDVSGAGMDQMAGLVIAAAAVACIWSIGVSGVILLRSSLHILMLMITLIEKLLDKLWQEWTKLVIGTCLRILAQIDMPLWHPGR